MPASARSWSTVALANDLQPPLTCRSQCARQDSNLQPLDCSQAGAAPTRAVRPNTLGWSVLVSRFVRPPVKAFVPDDGMLVPAAITMRLAKAERIGHILPVTPPAHEPPFALDGTVTRDKLIELLGVQTELTWMDYKQACDLSGAAGTVELTKDVGAMMIQGGYLVIGADDSRTPVGISATEAVHFDEATLAAKLAKYLPGGFEVRSAVHDLDDGTGARLLAVIWVAPHPDGWCVFRQNGDYAAAGGKTKTAFRAGEV